MVITQMDISWIPSFRIKYLPNLQIENSLLKYLDPSYFGKSIISIDFYIYFCLQVRPNNAMPQQRTLSMPQLPGEPHELGIPLVKSPVLYSTGPPKPPRSAAGLERAMQLAAEQRGLDKAEIRTALQNWQLGLMMGEEDKRLYRPRTTGDGKPAGNIPYLNIPSHMYLY